MRKQNVWRKGLIAGLYMGYGLACLFLFYHMCLPTPGRYHSDIPAHINNGMRGEGYSFLEIIYKIICNAGVGSKGIPLLLTLIALASVFLCYLLMCQMLPGEKRLPLHLLAFAVNFEMPLYLPFIHKYQNIGLQTGSMWHNDTYLGMRLFGLLVLLIYFKHQTSYKETFRLRQWLCFAAALFMANFMKPNFLLCFAPAMGVMLLADLFKSRGREIKSIFWFGLAVIPSLSILIFQSIQLFGEGTNGGSIAFSAAYILRLRNEHPVWAILQSAAFPLCVLVFNAKDLFSDRIYRTSWLIWLFGFLEFLFLNQTGDCINDGNLTWGYSFCLTLIFAVCAAKLYGKAVPIFEREKDRGVRMWVQKIWVIVCGGLLLWHLIDGLYFFAGLLRGLPYAR